MFGLLPLFARGVNNILHEITFFNIPFYKDLKMSVVLLKSITRPNMAELNISSQIYQSSEYG